MVTCLKENLPRCWWMSFAHVVRMHCGGTLCMRHDGSMGTAGDHAHAGHDTKVVKALCGRTKRDRQIGSLCFSQKWAQLCEQHLRHVAHACTETRALSLHASTGRLVWLALNTGCMPDCPCDTQPQTVYHSVAEMKGFQSALKSDSTMVPARHLST